MRDLFFIFFFIFFSTITVLGQNSEMYRLTLKDKGNSPYSIERPQEFLSQKAIERRIKQGFAIDETDLPIDPEYFEELTSLGASIHAYSKWVKTIVVNINNPELKDLIDQLPFVEKMTKVWEGDLSLWGKSEEIAEPDIIPTKDSSSNGRTPLKDIFYQEKEYGKGITQIKLNNALPLHQLGYRGKGMTIAVMDGGFQDVDKLSSFFDIRQILGVKNFTHNQTHPFRLNELHGTMVLSCMLSNNPEELIGTAPDANYYLLNTEVGKEEYPVEEDYWVTAVEYADSIGVDIITTSLGYSSFDDSSMNHSWEELDGVTIPASRAASMAAQKGMVLFISCGNQGNSEWQKVSPPGDARNIITVGAVNKDSIKAKFSSWGYIGEDRIKPDVMAMGQGVSVAVPAKKIIPANGTSFSTPLLAGMSTCLWQALPELNSLELMQLIKVSADKYFFPDEYYGYGLPDIYKAYNLNKPVETSSQIIPERKERLFYVDNSNHVLYLTRKYNSKTKPQLQAYTPEGILVLNQPIEKDSYNLSFLQKGIYILSITTEESISVLRYKR